MAISNAPLFFNMNYTEANGNLTPNAHLYNDELNQVIQQIVEQLNNGIQVPQKTTAEITAYGADAQVPVGTIWFATDLLPFPKLQVKTAAATIETIQSL